MNRKALYRLAPYAIVIVAASLRLATLTWHSLDGDEGASLNVASLPVSEILAHFADLTVDAHPLTYYLGLKAWIRVAGESDVAVRLLSVLVGILTVALAYYVGRRLFPRSGAALLTALVALNPMLNTESQDVRSYALGVMFAVAALGALLKLAEAGALNRRKYFLIALAALTLMSYSHLAGGMLLPGFALAAVWGGRWAKSRRWLVGAVVIAGMVYAPYLLSVYQAGSGRPSLPLWEWPAFFAQAIYRLWLYRAPLPAPAGQWILLAALGVIIPIGAWRARANGLLLLAWFVPAYVLIVYIAIRMGALQPKTLAFLVVPWALLLTAGLTGHRGRWRWLAGAAVTLILASQVYGLSYIWRPGYQKEDFRSAANIVTAQATPDDLVLVHLSWYQSVFRHYYLQPFIHPLLSNISTDRQVQEALEPLLSEPEVIWLVQAGAGLPGSIGDPERFVEKWLAARLSVAAEVYPGGVDVKGYLANYRRASLPAWATATAVAYPNGLNLAGYRIPERQLPATDRWLHPPSTWVHVTLYWAVDQPLAGDVRMAVTLEDGAGNVWGGDLPRSNDLRAFYPPLDWQPGEVIRQDFDVNTNPAVAPGEYKVVLRVYPAGNPAPLLNQTGEDWFILDRVLLTP